MQLPDIIVIGAGPAGLLAAGTAACGQRRVWLLEKMEKPARKLCITGKGRCNITNTKPWNDFEAHVFPQSRQFKPAFMNFPNTALLRFMEQAGVPLVVERGDRVFPASSQAQDVAEALVHWAQSKNVDIRCRTEALRLIADGGKITAVEARANGRLHTWRAGAFIIATGGLSYPATGATGDGFRWAEATGHTVTPLFPSLVALKTANPPAALSGLALRNVSLTLFIEGRATDEAFGELVFTGDGVDGPIVLQLSHRAVDALRQNKKVTLELNCKPALSGEQMLARLQRETATFADAPLCALLRKWLPEQLVMPFLEKAKLPPKKKAAQLSAQDQKQIISTLHSWKMEVSGYGGYERAVITAGGVSMRDIDPKTMRSRKIDNLFFAGETLDLYADTGGYNLQIAFSTGYLAGKSAAI
ncbi:MAG: aminoacetone oxidase family FAD-binding enzyme [Prevotellaceae bacterium]|jgi:predicted Rossmann fold flavoprotein|nr:aminoacetone oxidase family FAD-binding enzyme [Prevotellaceae bacterium]